MEEFTHDALNLHYDELSDLLGGASWQEAFERWILAGLSPARQSEVSAWKDHLSGPSQFLYPGDRSFPLEVLWLKWNLFTGLSRAVYVYHQTHKSPHLSLQPASLRVAIPPFKSPFLPVRWSFSMKTLEDSKASPSRDPQMPLSMLSRLFEPPADLQKVYAAPILRDRPPAEVQRVTVLIRSMEQVRKPETPETIEDGIKALLETQIISEDIRPSEYSEMDVFKIGLCFPDEQTPALRVWASKKASLDRGLLLQGVSDPMDPALWGRLQNTQNQVFNRSMLTFYKTYHVPCDLYSLGMLLLRTLFVHDRQNLSDLEPQIGRIHERLEPMVQGVEAGDSKTLSMRLRTWLGEEGDLFSKNSILYREEDRRLSGDSTSAVSAIPAIPDDIWYDALLLGLRLLTWIPGFSYCRNHGDYEMKHPDRLMERVLADVERLGRRIHGELFGSRRRNREVLEACDRVRQELLGARSG